MGTKETLLLKRVLEYIDHEVDDEIILDGEASSDSLVS